MCTGTEIKGFYCKKKIVKIFLQTFETIEEAKDSNIFLFI